MSDKATTSVDALISDATACRYLGILEKEHKVKRVGTAGRWVSYVDAS